MKALVTKSRWSQRSHVMITSCQQTDFGHGGLRGVRRSSRFSQVLNEVAHSQCLQEMIVTKEPRQNSANDNNAWPGVQCRLRACMPARLHACTSIADGCCLHVLLVRASWLSVPVMQISIGHGGLRGVQRVPDKSDDVEVAHS